MFVCVSETALRPQLRRRRQEVQRHSVLQRVSEADVPVVIVLEEHTHTHTPNYCIDEHLVILFLSESPHFLPIIMLDKARGLTVRGAGGGCQSFPVCK